MSTDLRSPYERVLGPRLDDLHPRLRDYFRTIPDGHVGIGIGVFDRAGSPIRVLRPLLRAIEPLGVLFGTFERDVPFRVVNRTVRGRAVARREFALADRGWTMVDAVSLSPAGALVDTLGHRRTVVASFAVVVREGALELVSRDIGVRLGRLRWKLPRVIAPIVRLTERYDDEQDRQRVDLTIDAPVLGRVFEYRGTFTYLIEEEQG